ncbi:PucR family transcriptional regulator [Streptomyces armeniacus]|uniref:PucR family transcriptional regulator n=2 Tax=Streptomyces armeniacus TaxID=83291 RepID=A0A345Y1S4_9ACTN|nr:PucR family transcriptional regulator [Streptomyces armeniacus]
MADPVPYLLGGELLLSAGVHCPAGARTEAAARTETGHRTEDDPRTENGHRTEDDGARTEASAVAHWERYVERTVTAGAAALGFGIAPLHDEVPPALADACDRHGLPLLRVPPGTPFTAVARTLWQLVAERRHAALRRLSEAQQALTSAAARPHPVPAVLARFARHTGAWAALFGPDGAELAGAGTPPDASARAAVASLTAQLRPGPSSASSTSGAWFLSAYALTGAAGGGGGRLALGVCAPQRDSTADAAARVAVVLLSLLTGHRTAGAAAGRTAALVRLLLGAAPEEAAALIDGGTDRWTVVHGRRDPYEAQGGREPHRADDEHRTDRDEAPGDGPLAAAALAAGLGTSLVDRDGEVLRALVPGGRPVPARPGWTLGASAPVPAAELGRADAEAARALRRALAARRPVVCARPADARGVTSLLDGDEARPLARSLLAPLEGRPELAETLRVWLSVHGSWDRSASVLGVHRNTVRQRVARIGGLLGADLGDPDVRMELWFALKWL